MSDKSENYPILLSLIVIGPFDREASRILGTAAMAMWTAILENVWNSFLD